MRLEALTKTFPDGTEAVKGIDLDLVEGRFAVLLGPSGCGKTTALRMVAGLEAPTSGRILLAERDITILPASRRDVGFVFQFYALYPHMNVRNNIGFPLDNLGVNPADRDARVCATARRLGIESLLDRHPNQLSGGDQQRVSLARAMVRDPSIYLMDEPLGQLDTNIRLELREAIRSQQLETGVTTVYVTHDQEEALNLADDVIVMNEGRIEQIGSPEDIYYRPETLFVANFVGSSGMNTVEGTVRRVEGNAVFRSGSGSLQLSQPTATGDVTLGIRPECVRIVPTGSISGSVRISEYFGDHHLIHLDTDFGDLSARSAEARPVGERVRIDFDVNRIRLFDPRDGGLLQ